MTCMFGIMFLILGNIAGNGIAFGVRTVKANIVCCIVFFLSRFADF
jgi:hypothetical protein